MVLAVGALVFLGVQHVAKNYLSKPGSGEHSEVVCRQHGVTHAVAIKNGVMVPQHTNAALCDRLTVTNQDDQIRDLAFGAHDHHQTYDGQTESTIKKGQSVTVVLHTAGDFMFHDHLQNGTKGTFTVK